MTANLGDEEKPAGKGSSRSRAKAVDERRSSENGKVRSESKVKGEDEGTKEGREREWKGKGDDCPAGRDVKEKENVKVEEQMIDLKYSFLGSQSNLT